MEFFSVVTTLTVFIMASQLIWVWLTRLPPSCRIKMLAGNIALVGHICLFANRSWFNCQKLRWYRKYGDSFIVWFFTRRVIFTRDVYVCEKVLTSSEYLSKGLDGYWVLEEWLGNGLILSEGAVWRKRRKMITPAFHFAVLNRFVRAMEKQSMVLVDILREQYHNGKKVDVFTVTKPYSMSIICETAMGINVPQQQQQQSSGDDKFQTWFQMVGDMMFQCIVYPWLWSKQISKLTRDGRTLCTALDNLQIFVKNVVEKRIESRRRGNQHHQDGCDGDSSSTKNRIFMDTLLDAFECGDIDLEGILNEVNTFVNAGFETTSTALAWCLYLIGRNPEAQAKLHEELVGFHRSLIVDGGHLKAIDLQDLRKLKYTECIIRETLRIHPPVPVIARTLKQNSQIGDGNRAQIIPKGVLIIDILSMNRNLELWDSPMDFRPERFDSETSNPLGCESKRNRVFSYIPFSAGQRNCVGQRFAMSELKLALYHLVRNFEITASQDESELEETYDFFHGCANGLWLEFKPRNETR